MEITFSCIETFSHRDFAVKSLQHCLRVTWSEHNSLWQQVELQNNWTIVIFCFSYCEAVPANIEGSAMSCLNTTHYCKKNCISLVKRVLGQELVDIFHDVELCLNIFTISFVMTLLSSFWIIYNDSNEINFSFYFKHAKKALLR